MDEWFGNIRGDILSGLVVYTCFNSKQQTFSIIAGVDQKLVFYASFLYS